MQHGDRLAQERRGRLAAELMLEQVQAELSAANQKIAATNRELSDEIVDKREEVQQVRTVAETLRDENLEVKTSLEEAESAIMIAERRLWDSLETIHDGFAVFDSERVMVAANRAYIAAFDGLEMVGPGIHYHEMLKIMCEEGIVDLEETRPEDWQMMMAARWDSERVEPVTVKLWNGAFVKVIDRRTRDGDMVSLGLNITSTIQREAELERARARAEAANRAKSAFLANMSHEIRTPMNGVIGMADMLSETGLDDEQRLFVETIRNSGEALLVIINDVLDYSKIEAKKLELHPARFDLERCIHEVLMLLQPSAHDKGLQLAVDYDMFMPTEFVGDPGRVRQILTNLAGNAVKFTEAGHVAIRVVGLPVRDGASYRVHVTVEDSGIGIPDEKLKSIFGEFSQVEDERNRRYDGTGLGLAITKRLVEMMEGEVWVDSEVNVGSGFGFHITMPVAEGAATPPISAPDWIERAIVVDEPQMTRAILTKQLAAMGLQAHSARAGADLDALAPTAWDVVILGDAGIAERLAPRLSAAGAPQAVALLSAPLAGVALPGVAAALQKPAQRRDIARVLGALPEPPARTAEAPGPHIRDGPATKESVPAGFDAQASLRPEDSGTAATPATPEASMGAAASDVWLASPSAFSFQDGAAAPTPEVGRSEAAPHPAADAGTSQTIPPPDQEYCARASPAADETLAHEVDTSSDLRDPANRVGGNRAADAAAEPGHGRSPAPAPESPSAKNGGDVEGPGDTVNAEDADFAAAGPASIEGEARMADEPLPSSPPFHAGTGAQDPSGKAANPAESRNVAAAAFRHTRPSDAPSQAPPFAEIEFGTFEVAPAPGWVDPATGPGAPPLPEAKPQFPPDIIDTAGGSPPSAEHREGTPGGMTAPGPDRGAFPASPSATDDAADPAPPSGLPPHPRRAGAVQPESQGPPVHAPGSGTSAADRTPAGMPPASGPAPAGTSAAPHLQAPEPAANPFAVTEITRTVPPAAAPDPAQAPQADSIHAPVPPAPRQTPDACCGSPDADSRRMRVLAAEDNKTNRLVFSKMVQSLDIDLVFAENGREAVAAFEAEIPDLIFTDISMPEMDGKEASRRIRRIEAAQALPRTPIVAITAHAMAGDSDEILAAGIDTYLTKPLKRSALVEAIRGARPPGVRDPVSDPPVPGPGAAEANAPAMEVPERPVDDPLASPLSRTAAE